MSAALRKFRALLFAYVDAGSSGGVDSAYQVLASVDDDAQWWCSKGVPSGREVTTGAAPGHRTDAVFGFAVEAPVQLDGAILCDGEGYVIHAVLPRDYGRDEVQVLAARNADVQLAPP